MTSQAMASRVALTTVMLALVMWITSCASSSEADPEVEAVGAREAVTLIASDQYVVVDLRTPEAFEAGHLSGARSLPYAAGEFREQLDRLDAEAKYLLYSRDPDISRRAGEIMVSLGFTHVVDAGPFGLLALAGAEVE